MISAFPEKQQVSERSSSCLGSDVSCDETHCALCVSKAPPLASSTPVQRVEPTVVSFAKRPTPSAVVPASPPPQPPVSTARSKPKIILSCRNEPIGLNVADFLPVSFRSLRPLVPRVHLLPDLLHWSISSDMKTARAAKKVVDH